MNTFERHFRDFEIFLQKILSWSPDYLVPVAKKGCKLLKTIPNLPQLGYNADIIKYREFFELTNASVLNKKVAVVDDATQYTSTLQDYRRYFENIGATVRTFSFVGHEQLRDGTRWKEDEYAEIAKYLPEPVYQEYILQQSYHLLSSAQHFDLDHLVFEINLPRNRLQELYSVLRTKGQILNAEDYFLKSNIKRFSLDAVLFFEGVPYLEHKAISLGPMKKIKFAYDEEKETLSFSPLIFPSWDFSKSTLGGPLFQEVPFELPFKLPEHIDTRNRSAIRRTYYNVYFVFVVSLAKAFVQEVLVKERFSQDIAIRRNDLDAVLGTALASTFINGVNRFISDKKWIEFKWAVPPVEALKFRPRYSTFAEVIDDLRKGYGREVKKRRTMIGVHYKKPYEKLFKQFKDKTMLSEDLDYLCDFGAIVPGIMFYRGTITRGCRTGEVNNDYNWQRTRVLIPMAMQQFCTVIERQNRVVEPTVLNKLLSNFTFDYPSDAYHELHCLIGEPYTFGTLVRAYHRHRAPSKPNIYQADRISPYYEWNDSKGEFVMRKPAHLIEEIRSAFDERQEVPYSEIVTYFKLLSRIYKHFRNVDVLNMLSICREQNYFYVHILYNVRTALENCGLYLDKRNSKQGIETLLRAEENAVSAKDKLELAKKLPEVLRIINQQFGSDIECLKVLERLNKNTTQFSAEFHDTLRQVANLIRLEFVFINLCLLSERKSPNYKEIFERLDGPKLVKQFGIDLPDDLIKFVDNPEKYAPAITTLYGRLIAALDALPSEEKPLLDTRLRNEARSRARNIATSCVYKNNLSQIVLLYVDYSGLRAISEPAEDTISHYYNLVDKNVRKRGGQKLYGGIGGDDMYTILFADIGPAMQCAQDIKKEFSGDIFLRQPNADVKFGLCFTVFSSDKKEQQVIQCWGTAKDCCEFKYLEFRNSGHLLTSDETIQNIRASKDARLAEKFEPLDGVLLKNGEQIYRYLPIEPLEPFL